MTRRTFDASAAPTGATAPIQPPAPAPLRPAASREVAVVDDDCATCHGTGSNANGDPCRPCGVGLTPRQRENVARLRVARFAGGLSKTADRQGF
jgi:hypothetical protein